MCSNGFPLDVKPRFCDSISVRPVARQNTFPCRLVWWLSTSCRATAKRHGFMRLIQLTRGFFAKVDEVDYDWLSQYCWCVDNPSDGLYYAVRTVGKHPLKKFLMHRVILGISDCRKVDHRDGDGLNNQRFNLRPATNSQNNGNQRRPINNKSGFKGVYWNKRMLKWHAQITIFQRRTHIGVFDNKVEAAFAYDAAAREHFGEFARTNFPD